MYPKLNVNLHILNVLSFHIYMSFSPFWKTVRGERTVYDHEVQMSLYGYETLEYDNSWP